MFATRFYLEDHKMYDGNNGKEGGFILTYTGEARKHPWPSREGEFLMDGSGTAKLNNGDVYVGEFEFGMCHGNGKMEYHNKDIYEGQWLNNLRHGYGVLESPGAGVSYLGTFKYGEKDGAGEETFDDGTTFAGMFRNGLRNGVGRTRVKSNGDIIDGIYVDGKLHGLVTVSYGNGDVFVGRFERGQSHGEGKYTQIESGDVYTEIFEYGRCVEGVLEDNEDPVGDLKKYSQKDAPSDLDSPSRVASVRQRRQVCNVAYFHSKDHYVGEWKREASGANRRGVRHGHGVLTYHATGDVYEGNFENDLREGYGVVRFNTEKQLPNDASGRIALTFCGTFHLDQYDGEGSIEYSDGSVTRQFFSKGCAHGLCHEYRPPMSFSAVSDGAGGYRPTVLSKMFEHDAVVALNYHEREVDVVDDDNNVGR